MREAWQALLYHVYLDLTGSNWFQLVPTNQSDWCKALTTSQLTIDADEMLWHAWSWKFHGYVVRFRFTSLFFTKASFLWFYPTQMWHLLDLVTLALINTVTKCLYDKIWQWWGRMLVGSLIITKILKIYPIGRLYICSYPCQVLSFSLHPIQPCHNEDGVHTIEKCQYRQILPRVHDWLI